MPVAGSIRPPADSDVKSVFGVSSGVSVTSGVGVSVGTSVTSGTGVTGFCGFSESLESLESSESSCWSSSGCSSGVCSGYSSSSVVVAAGIFSLLAKIAFAPDCWKIIITVRSAAR